MHNKHVEIDFKDEHIEHERQEHAIKEELELELQAFRKNPPAKNDNIITIKNKLEVKLGAIVNIPGCEPVSSLTSLGLLRNFDCKSSVISVEDFLELIPEAKLVRVTVPMGNQSTGFMIELPSGPPPDGESCPNNCMPDWYAILKTRLREREEPMVGCDSSINFTGCETDIDPFKAPRDPKKRPNNEPLDVPGNFATGEMPPPKLPSAIPLDKLL